MEEIEMSPGGRNISNLGWKPDSQSIFFVLLADQLGQAEEIKI